MSAQEGTYRSLLKFSMTLVTLGMPDCQLGGSVPVKPFPDSCSACRADSCDHASGSVPAVHS